MPTPKKDSSINISPVILPNLRKEFCKLFAESVIDLANIVAVTYLYTVFWQQSWTPLGHHCSTLWMGNEANTSGESGRNHGAREAPHKCSSFFRIDISSTLIHLENKRWIWSTWRSTMSCKMTTHALRAKRMVKIYHWRDMSTCCFCQGNGSI